MTARSKHRREENSGESQADAEVTITGDAPQIDLQELIEEAVVLLAPIDGWPAGSVVILRSSQRRDAFAGKYRSASAVDIAVWGRPLETL